MQSHISTLKYWLQCFWRGLREWCGDAAYDRYLDFAARTGAPHPLTPAEFYVEHTNQKFSRPNRCC
jgi:hypothetical protein